jgi:hypothetical protein
VNFNTEEEKQHIVKLLSDRFPTQELHVYAVQNSPTICVAVVTCQQGAVDSSEIANYLADNKFKVEVMDEGHVEINPEHFTTVAEWRLPAEWRQVHATDAWVYITQERDCKRLRAWVDGGDGVNIFDCTDLIIGQKALQAWEDAGRPPLNRELPPDQWPFPEDDADWSAAEGVES